MYVFSEEYITKLLQGIFDGSITPYELPTNLYFDIAEYLKKGLYEGFGATLADLVPDSTDYELLAELRENIYMFSAAKTYQETREMTDMLTDGDKVRSFREFKEEASKVFTQYNENYLRTEYNTAIGQAQMASKWQQIERDKDIFPNLRYSTIGDACKICGPLDGFTAPVDDPAWDTITPMNHFECACVLEQHDEDAELTPKEDRDELLDTASGLMQPTFRMNPGKDKVVFDKEHPYFDVAPKDRDFAEMNFGLPIPEDDGE
ncbi:MAG: hypothetical protein EOP56_09370 [Sphingobacteriales bacterium]|nr:MAG: hypothetical protein EOP56_09370 [Sphingobacteriales bacterium]